MHPQNVIRISSAVAIIVLAFVLIAEKHANAPDLPAIRVREEPSLPVLDATDTPADVDVQKMKEVAGDALPIKAVSSVEETVWVPLTDAECEDIEASSLFYRNPLSQTVHLEEKIRASGDTKTADLLREISCYPQAAWFANPDGERMKALAEELSTTAEQAGKIPIFVLYSAAQSDTILWRFGNQGQDLLNWIRAIGEGIGQRRAWIILEPDALGMSLSYSKDDKEYRLFELKRAVETLKETAPNARVYIDAANSGWWDPDHKADLLEEAGIDMADGFAVNVSNYHALQNEIDAGLAISDLLGGNTHFVIDTGRNGNGSTGGWCNLPDKALGKTPSAATPDPRIDAYLWIKPPGESDGECNGGPRAGTFFLEYALTLVRNAYGIPE